MKQDLEVINKKKPMTTIYISKPSRNKLQVMKYDLGLSNVEDVIVSLLEKLEGKKV